MKRSSSFVKWWRRCSWRASSLSAVIPPHLPGRGLWKKPNPCKNLSTGIFSSPCFFRCHCVVSFVAKCRAVGQGFDRISSGSVRLGIGLIGFSEFRDFNPILARSNEPVKKSWGRGKGENTLHPFGIIKERACCTGYLHIIHSRLRFR